MRISDWSSDVCSSDLYGELAIPVFDAGESFPGSFRLSAAGRYEDYSDVGDTANPKFGARWEPLPGVALRASYRSEEHTSELQSLMRISYAVFCLKKKKK